MDFEVIIAGAGPAGLSVAKELGKKHSVLLIDAKKVPGTNAAWYSYTDRVKKYGLGKAVKQRCNGIVFEAEGLRHVMRDSCVVLDSNTILKMWYDKAMEGDVTLCQEQLSVRSGAEGVRVTTKTKGRTKVHTARLLIDCTGFKSPVIKKHKLITTMNSWVLYGARITTRKRIKDRNKILFLPVNDNRNSYFGIYPRGKNEADAYIFFNLEDEPGDIKEARSIFRKNIRHIIPKFTAKNELYGRIVSGELKQYAFDNIIFFGEAAMLNPPGIGMGFNEVLVQHQKFSKKIHQALRNETLERADLEKIAESIRDPATFKFQQVMGKFTYYFIHSAGRWKAGVQWLNALGGSSKQWMRNEINTVWIKRATQKLHDAIPLTDVARMMPHDAYWFVVEHMSEFLADEFVEEAERAEHRFVHEFLHPTHRKRAMTHVEHFALTKGYNKDAYTKILKY